MTSSPSSWPTRWGQALDAAELIDIDYDPLPSVTDADAALAPDAPLLYEEHGSNLVFETRIGQDDDPVSGTDAVVECRVISQRLAGVPMEPNGCLAIPGADGHLTVWIPSQNPVAVRDAMAGQLGLEPADLRVAAPVVGGGFGSKAGTYTEFLITARLALVTGRPVKWTEQRSENMVSMAQGRDQRLAARMGLTDDGRITGLDIDVVAGCGAYPAVGGFLTVFTQLMSQGVYDVPKFRYHARSAAHEQHPHRRLPGCRTPRGHPAARTNDGHGRGTGRHGSGRDSPAQLHPTRPVSLHDPHRGHL